jgi:uncharacterized spore protein YtfJ
MDVQDVVDRFRDTVNVRRVYGDPIEQDGATVIPAAKLRGGGGGGGRGGSGGQEEGTERSGGGFGMNAKPAGAFVFRGGKVRWVPALDLNRVILGGQMVAAAALLAFGSRLLGRRPAGRRWFGRTQRRHAFGG